MKTAQIGWIFFLIGYLGKRIQCSPGNIGIAFPKLYSATCFSEEKLLPSIKSTPEMRNLINIGENGRRGGHRINKKTFSGGFISMVSANSIGDLKSTPLQLDIIE